MRGFVKQRRGLLIFAGEEVGRAGAVDINAQRDADLWLRGEQRLRISSRER